MPSRNFRDLVLVSKFDYERLTWRKVIFDLLYESNSLAFNMQPQTQSNWCWAATATSVSLFYRPSSTWTQCRVANAELALTGCCGSPVPAACNVPWYLDRALQRTDNFVSYGGPASVAQVRSEIQAGRPVGARIGWSGGGGHFMVIYGVASVGVTSYFHIDDPIYGKTRPSVATFSGSYQGSGSWTHAYFTTAPVLMIKIKPYLLSERLVRPVWQARHLLAMGHPSLERIERAEDLSLALPHEAYTLGLDALRETPRLPEAPYGLRVLEMQRDQPTAVFDLDLRGEPEVMAMAGPSPDLDGFQRALTQALKHAAREPSETELRLLRVPALYVDAVWLHYDEPGKDVLIPWRAPQVADPFVVYSAADFLARLAKAAAVADTADELKGA